MDLAVALSFLYRRNAELCAAMAAAARSAEIRRQWIDLAEHWSQKAEFDECAGGATTKHEVPAAFNIAASLEKSKPTEDLQRFNVTTLTPTLVPEEMPSSTESPAGPDPSQQACSEKKLDEGFEDDWTKLIADIRSK
jgi:hypothetical protein